MKMRYILSALLVAAMAVACDSSSDDPQPTVPGTNPGGTVKPSGNPGDTQPPVVVDPVLNVLNADTVVAYSGASFKLAVEHLAVEYSVTTNNDEMISIELIEQEVDEGEIARTDINDPNDDVVIPENPDTNAPTITYYSVIIWPNTTSEERVGQITFSAEGVEDAVFTITQESRGDVTFADDSITSTITSMSGTDFVLGPIPMEIKGTLTYSVTCAARNYNQGTLTISKSELCETLGITEADFDARKGNTIDCLPMNRDWSEGTNTAGGSYGAWFGSSGTIAWGSSSIAYIEGSDMLSFIYGMHPENNSNSTVCRLQYRDKANETACNVEVTVSLK
ncbi:MAG: DUF4859 domain-containing protein [Marinifilaceae bacterium]|nr:DUF4859 domain-containing protein [Marinifilaceae bacterium]